MASQATYDELMNNYTRRDAGFAYKMAPPKARRAGRDDVESVPMQQHSSQQRFQQQVNSSLQRQPASETSGNTIVRDVEPGYGNVAPTVHTDQQSPQHRYEDNSLSQRQHAPEKLGNPTVKDGGQPEQPSSPTYTLDQNRKPRGVSLREDSPDFVSTPLPPSLPSRGTPGSPSSTSTSTSTSTGIVSPPVTTPTTHFVGKSVAENSDTADDLLRRENRKHSSVDVQRLDRSPLQSEDVTSTIRFVGKSAAVGTISSGVEDAGSAPVRSYSDVMDQGEEGEREGIEGKSLIASSSAEGEEAEEESGSESGSGFDHFSGFMDRPFRKRRPESGDELSPKTTMPTFGHDFRPENLPTTALESSNPQFPSTPQQPSPLHSRNPASLTSSPALIAPTTADAPLPPTPDQHPENLTEQPPETEKVSPPSAHHATRFPPQNQAHQPLPVFEEDVEGEREFRQVMEDADKLWGDLEREVGLEWIQKSMDGG